ncbi:DUF2381 family protein [Archangium sp.]|uniref:DUF2381 family protein n=1 Tax=Archangium sp. TaxID=1872627 RepID=UPI00286C5C08|nr:DUF2381 family protein [Archangium sp.]
MAVARDRKPYVRNVYLRGNPKHQATSVYVTGEVVTVLRFQQPCDPARTKLLGWEGRFEPVECAGKRVLVEPLQDLKPEDGFLLLVTLADGKELPFTVTAIAQNKEWEWPDQQVNVFLDPESPAALRKQLDDTRARERRLEEANERHWRENTTDHALARLLKKGDMKLTQLRVRRRWFFKEEGMDLDATFLSGKGKAAVLVQVTNRDPAKAWSLAEARLRTTRPGEKAPILFGEARPFALQKDWGELAPGASGTLAIVVDKSAFTSQEGPCDLTVELYRHDGLLVGHVVLDRRLVR